MRDIDLELNNLHSPPFFHPIESTRSIDDYGPTPVYVVSQYTLPI